MFLLNIGYRWSQLGMDDVRGAVFMPSRMLHGRVADIGAWSLRQRLLDPQAYLSGLDSDECSKVCVNLASYPWFITDVPTYDSDTLGRREWVEEARGLIGNAWSGELPTGDDISVVCHHALVAQDEGELSEIILPAPLITEREDEAATLGTWLDAGLEVAEELELDRPLLATIVLHEGLINSNAFRPTGILATIVDQVVARNGITGAYIGIAQTTKRHPFQLPRDVARAYARLVQLLARAGFEYIIVNFADLFGYVCTGLGATTFVTGPSHTLRRLSTDGFRDQRGGMAFPHFYSHPMAAELRTEGDLDRVVEARLVRRTRDITEFSQSLMAELARGGSARNLPAWAESQSNVTAAQSHYIARLAALGAEQGARASDDRSTAVRDWLERAAANQLLLTRRLQDQPHGELAPVGEWLDIFDEFSD